MKNKKSLHNRLPLLLWGVILAYIFIKPFTCSRLFLEFNFIANFFFALCSTLYIWFCYRQKGEYKISAIDKIIIFYIVGILISVIFSLSPLKSISKMYLMFTPILFIYIIKFTNEKQQNQLLLTIIISAILINIYALYGFFFISPATLQFLKSNSIKYPFAVDFLSRRRAFYPFVTPNLLANYLVIIITISSGLLMGAKKTRYSIKYLYWPCIASLILSLFVLLLTKSIGGWITLLLILFFMAIKTKIINRKLIIFILVIVILVTLTLLITRSITPDKGNKIQFSIKQRLSYWAQTLKIIKQYPLTGQGLGVFQITSTKYAHNSYMQLWAEAGIITIAAWLSLCFAFLKKNLGRLATDERSYKTLALVSGGLAFLLHNMIDFSFFFPQVSFLWWILLGLTASNKVNH